MIWQMRQGPPVEYRIRGQVCALENKSRDHQQVAWGRPKYRGKHRNETENVPHGASIRPGSHFEALFVWNASSRSNCQSGVQFGSAMSSGKQAYSNLFWSTKPLILELY